MPPFSHRLRTLSLLPGALLLCQKIAAAPVLFEARHTHPVALTPDGKRLLALNTPEARLSVFDVSTTATVSAPQLIAEIPVGLEPVSVRARTNDEVWVVNELSDSVSIVSLSRRVTVATLSVPDEPADVVFAAGKAFVSCARNNLIRVVDPDARTETLTVPLEGVFPRALTVNAAGDRVYAAFFLSGNNTTILPASAAPPPPPPANPALPPAPQTGLIVPADDPRVPYTVLDHDVAEISAADGRVLRYFGGMGTNHHAIAAHPATGEIWTANTEALNLIRFEPALRGHFIDNRLTRVSPADGRVTVHDLNPGIDYTKLPNPEARAVALAQPAALAMSADGAHVWTAAFGSDRVAKVDAATGAVLARIDLRLGDSAGESSRHMRGPRGLALGPDGSRLYTLNKLSNTVSVIDTAAGTVIFETPAGSHDPLPANVREGRGFLFDARLSGNGTVSCASCHPDADRDGLAWDLGDPGGDMLTVMGADLSQHDPTPKPRVMHPMKGPMTTQTLRGMRDGAPFHWRGDRATIAHFNPTFSQLMGGDQISEQAMADLTAYLQTIPHHPNPNRNPDRTLPASFAGGNPVAGRDLYNDVNRGHCIDCHAHPTGSDNNIDSPREVGSSQPLKTPPLRTVYQRIFFNPRPKQTSPGGFGLLHDGSGYALPTVHPYVMDTLSTQQEFADVTAFVLCFDTGTAPAVGRSITVTAATAFAPETAAELDLLESQARAANTACDVVARGVAGGRSAHFVYTRDAPFYQPDIPGAAPLSRAELLASLSGDDALTFLGVYPGEGPRLGGDRNLNGVPDGGEPAPDLRVLPVPAGPRLSWPATAAGWFLESSGALNDPSSWQPAGEAARRVGEFFEVEPSPAAAPRRFFRLRRAW